MAGLRRDEVAFLAGVSSHYYARLEQGRDRHPPDAVLGALARVFDLDDVAIELLSRLAKPTPTRRRRWTARETVSPSLARLLGALTDHPAVIIGATEMYLQPMTSHSSSTQASFPAATCCATPSSTRLHGRPTWTGTTSRPAPSLVSARQPVTIPTTPACVISSGSCH